MCGRFTIEIPSELLAELFGLPEPPSIQPRYNIAPTQKVPVIRQDADGNNRLDHLFWGLVPSWAKDRSMASKMINARSETIAEKPAFRQALRYRRCLVLSSGFYEWKQEGKAKMPLYIRHRDGSPMIFAGLWDSWKSPEGDEVIESCTILTTTPNELIEPYHQRMPVIVPAEEYGNWLDRKITDPAVLQRLFQHRPAQSMEMWPVSPSVNSPKNDFAELILPLAPTLF